MLPIGFPHWWLWGWEGCRNHRKYTEITENTRESPLIKKSLREVGWGYKLHQGEQIPFSRNCIPGPGALRQEPYRPYRPPAHSPLSIHFEFKNCANVNICM